MILVTSSVLLATGFRDVATQVLGRRRNYWPGIIGSYFVHRSWGHLAINFLFYALGVLVIYLYAKRVYPRTKIDLMLASSWWKWNVAVFSLMLSTGALDMFSNKLYIVTSAPSVGMSELVSAILAVALAAIWASAFSGGSKRSMLLLASLAASFSLMIVLSNTRAALLARVNVIAHMCGFSTGSFASLTSLIPCWRNRKVLYSSLAILLNYLLVMVCIYIMAVILRI